MITHKPGRMVVNHRSDWMTLHDGLSSILRNYACDMGEKKMRTERRLTKRCSGLRPLNLALSSQF